MTHKTTPVLVVGAGPSGLTASLLLSRFDIPHILIDKRSGPIAAPAAHVVNRRSMEIFRQAGGRDRLTALSDPFLLMVV